MSQQNPIRQRAPIAEADALEILASYDLVILGLMPWSSNSTFLVDLVDPNDRADSPAQAIYKPAEGERPLWDFPGGLHKREVAAFALSQQLEWNLVPPTVERDGEYGEGSLQLLEPTDYSEHYFTMIEAGTHTKELQRLCLFDFVANSTDRKSGHCIIDSEGKLWAIDNGLSFHHEFKLRTVNWEWAGQPIAPDMAVTLAAFAESGPNESLAALLDAQEAEVLVGRTRALVNEGRFPSDPTGQRYPWPLV